VGGDVGIRQEIRCCSGGRQHETTRGHPMAGHGLMADSVIESVLRLKTPPQRPSRKFRRNHSETMRPELKIQGSGSLSLAWVHLAVVVTPNSDRLSSIRLTAEDGSIYWNFKKGVLMQQFIRLRLDGQDLIDLIKGKVLYKDEDGRPLGTGDGFRPGEFPVQIVLSEGERAPFQQMLRPVNASDDHQIEEI